MNDVEMNYEEFILLKEKLRQINNMKYGQSYIFIDDFTYGDPHIMAWDEDTKLRIGKFCSIAEGVVIALGGEHHSEWVTTYPFGSLLPSYSYIKGHPKSKGDIIIGNDVWIGGHSKILSGVTIGDGSIIGANSLVTSDVPPYTIYGGVPAKKIKMRFDSEIIEKLQMMQWWEWPYKEIYKAIPLLQSNKIDELYAYYKELIK